MDASAGILAAFMTSGVLGLWELERSLVEQRDSTGVVGQDMVIRSEALLGQGWMVSEEVLADCHQGLT